MKERMKKNAEQYERVYQKWNKDKRNHKGAFTLGDIQEIADASANIYEAIDLALSSAFMIGYNCAKNERKARRA